MRRLRQIRKRRDLTLRAAAARVGISYQQIHDLESGNASPLNVGLRHCLALLEAFPELELRDFGYEGPLRLARRAS